VACCRRFEELLDMVKSDLHTVPGKLHGARRENVSFSDVGGMLGRNTSAVFRRRNMSLILGSSFVTLAMAVLYLLFAQPTYTARAQLLIDLKLPQFLQGSSAEPGYGLDASQLESHIVLLQSERVATAVINKLGLLQESEFQYKPGLFTGLLGSRPTAAEQLQYAIERFEDRLQVRRIGISYAVDVAFSSEDAPKAAKIANATTEAYLQSLIDFRGEAARVAVQPDSYTVSNVHLISKALTPTRKSWPKIPLVLALALAIGAFIGGCLALVRDIYSRHADAPPPANSR
jgi:uncharacterized protein involved in exopolysaccharide biosynthesis